ncbi:helix-turn-helix domain-containing protein [Flavobacteriaceae bacterium F89]|uniref:Helix-turn-helix domain-containing protein n=1 Tax=Cerina litoralis TaxID=2874477 RepID=A0AAE3EUJ7_9FLAO|nr:helix-turn-helix domain-containing protein [Cerina litoralis]MCG2461367.1 helix-turn-helix domain-containing protein [Cerina litoralis]
MVPPKELSMNEAFLKKVEDIVLQNFQNEQFGVVELAKQVGLSRSQLHRKLKLLSGKSISQFIREFRLGEAMKLLQSEVATVSEIAYRVGFGSPSYFIKSFHKYYGFSPGEAKTRSRTEYQNKITGSHDNPIISNDRKTKLGSIKAWVAITIGILIVATAITSYFYNPVRTPHKSIAVLPISNYTGDPEQDYFVQGFHDAVIGALGQISALRVISRTSTRQYSGENLPSIQEIAKALDVETVVEGSVMGSGNHIRIQLQLIEAFPQEKHLWSKEYIQDMRNINVLQNDLVRNIAKEIEAGMTPAEENLLEQATTVNPEAYKAYLKGKFHWEKLTEEDLNIAMEYFELARKLDPEYPLAYAGISLVWGGRLQQGLTSYLNHGTEMKMAALKAKVMELKNTPPEVYHTLGVISCWVDWNYEEAETYFRKAIALNPSYSSARAYLSHVLNILHKTDEAMYQIEMALKLDPFNPLYQALYGMDLMYSRQFNKAIIVLDKTLKKAPTDPVALSTLKTAYHMKSMYPEALTIWKLSFEAKGDPLAVEALQKGERANGYPGALEALAKMLIRRSDTTYVTPWQIATLYTRAGNKEKAITWLEKAYEARDNNMPYIGVDPIFEIMHSDPRFQDLLEKMNLTLRLDREL